PVCCVLTTDCLCFARKDSLLSAHNKRGGRTFLSALQSKKHGQQAVPDHLVARATHLIFNSLPAILLCAGRRREPDHPARLPVFRHTRAYDGTCVLFILLFLITSSIFAAPLEIRIPTTAVEGLHPFERNQPESPTFILALSGGGLRGLAHIGVLEVLDESGIRPDGIVGVSIGSLIGGLYASGLTPAEITYQVADKNFDFSGFLTDEPERRTLALARKEEHSRHILTIRFGPKLTPVVPGAISQGQHFYEQLLNLTLRTPYRTGGQWTHLKTEFQVLTTDLATGQGIVHNSGDITPAIRGSMSIPLVFDPFIWDTLHLIDGGITSNIPVEIAHKMGDVVVAVDVTAPLKHYDPPYQPWQIVDQVTTILGQSGDEYSLSQADVVIIPDVDGISSDDPINLDQWIQTGRDAMLRALPELQRMLNPPPAPDDTLFLQCRQYKIVHDSDSLGVSPDSTGVRPDSTGVNPPRLTPNSVVSTFSPPLTWQQAGGATVGEIRSYLRMFFQSGAIRDAWAVYDEEDGATSFLYDQETGRRGRLPAQIHPYQHNGDETLCRHTPSCDGKTLTFHIQHYPYLKDVIFHRSQQQMAQTSLSDDTLRGLFQPLIDERINVDAIQTATEQLLRLYRSSGYPVATIQRMEYDETTGKLIVGIDEGRLGTLKFVGLKRVSESWLAREIPLRPSDLITCQRILKGTANLYATGLFRNVYPVLTRNDNDQFWTMEVHITEQPVPLIRLGLSYLDEQKMGGFTEISYPGLFDYAKRLSLYSSLGQRDNEHRLTFAADKILGRPLMSSLAIAYQRKDRTLFTDDHRSVGNYTETRWGWKYRIGVQAWKWGLLSLNARWERHHNNYPDDDINYTLTALGGLLALDTQDRFPYPNNGIRMEMSFETAQYLIEQNSEIFSRLSVDWENYMTPARRHTFGLRLRGRIAEATTPFDEQFRLGGMHSLPGLRLDELTGIIQVATGLEYRFDLISRILADSYIGLRWDVAGNWNDPEARITRGDWIRTVSAYFALDTVIGPIQIQWGHLFSTNRLTADDRICIQIGNQF
ncbi:MAG: patatin-like phospholipase family protein, partial [Candidatus Electryoneaceae bacterium]|nr:patatin-like phospholipase family protein [Candidatus Electryoneaceae bacterium]